MADVFTFDSLPELSQDPQLPQGNFDAMIGPLLAREGGYVNDPRDRGGRTKYGISQKSYPHLDIANLTEDQAKDIYKRDYWDPSFDQYSPEVAEMLFDSNVNHGRGFTNKMLAEAGPDYNALREYRKNHYDKLASNPSQQGFHKGWMNRLSELDKRNGQNMSYTLDSLPGLPEGAFNMDTLPDLEEKPLTAKDLDKEIERAKMERDWPTAIHDFLLRTVGVSAGAVESIASLVDPGGAIASDAKGFREDIEANQLSEASRLISKQVSMAVKEAKDAGEYGLAAWWEQVMKNPVEVLGPEALGTLLPMGGIAKLSKAMVGAGHALNVMGVLNVAMTSGEVRNTFYQGVMSASDADLLENSVRYQVLRESMDELQAKKIIAEQFNAKLLAGMTAAGAIAWFTGRVGAEAALVNKAKGNWVATGGKEIASEGIEEGVTAFGGNLAKTHFDPNQSLGEDVYLSTFQGAVTGGPVGAASHALGGREKPATPNVKASDVDKQADKSSDKVKTAIEQLEAQVAGGIAPETSADAPRIVKIPDPHGHGVMIEVSTKSAYYKDYMARQNALADKDNAFIHPEKVILAEAEAFARSLAAPNNSLTPNEIPPEGSSLLSDMANKDHPDPYDKFRKGFVPTRNQFGLPFPDQRPNDPFATNTPNNPQGKLFNPNPGEDIDYEAEVYMAASDKPPSERTPWEKRIINRMAVAEKARVRAIEEAAITKILELHRKGAAEARLISMMDALHAKHKAEDVAVAEFMFRQSKEGKAFQLYDPNAETNVDWLPEVQEDRTAKQEDVQKAIEAHKNDPLALLEWWALNNSPNKASQFIVNRLAGFVSAYLNNGGKITIETTKSNEWRGLAHHVPPAKGGGYKKTFNDINLSFSQHATYETVVHEFIHAMTLNMIRQFEQNTHAFTTLFPKEAAAIQQMKQLQEYVVNQGPKVTTKYFPQVTVEGKRDLAEFITYGLTEPNSITYLKSVSYGKTNAFVEFFKYLGRVLGLDSEPNAHSELVRIFDELSRNPDRASKAVALSEEDHRFMKYGDYSNLLVMQKLQDTPRNVSEHIANTTPSNGVKTVMTANTTLDEALKSAEAKIELDYNSNWKSVNGKLVYKVDPNDNNPTDTSGISSIAHSLDLSRKALDNPAWVRANEGLVQAIKELNETTTKVITKLRGDKTLSPKMRAMTRLIGNDPAKLLRMGLTDPDFAKEMASKNYGDTKTSLYKTYLESVAQVMGIPKTDANSIGALSVMLDKAFAHHAVQQIKASDTPAHDLTPDSAHLRLPGMTGNFQSVATYDELKTRMSDGIKDIKESVLGKHLRSGMRHLMVKTGHPIIAFANFRIDRALSKVNFKMKAVLDTSDKNSQASLVMSMTEEEQEGLRVLLLRGDQLKHQIDPSTITGITPAQAAYINNHYKIDADILAEGQNAARATGQTLIEPVAGHVATKFGGVYRMLVRESSDPDAKPIGYIGEDTKNDLKLAEDWVKKKYPNAQIIPLPERKLSDQFNKIKNRSDIAKHLKDNGVVNEEFLEFAKAIDNQMYSMDKRVKIKLGIWGGEGNKPWKSESDNPALRRKNTHDFFKGQFTYYEDAYQHHALQSPLADLRRAGEEFIGQAPNAIKEVENYVDTVVHGKLNFGGEFFNGLIDGILKTSWVKINGKNYVGGSSWNSVKHGQSELRDYLTTMVLGWADMQYFTAQLVQPLQTARPFASMVAKDLKMPITSVEQAMARAAKTMMWNLGGGLLGKGYALDHDQKTALGYMMQEGLMGTNQMEHKSNLFRSKGAQRLKTVGEYSIKKGDSLTRPPVFMTFFELIRNSEKGRQMNLADVLDTAKNLTQYSMIDYNSWQRPLLYTQLGIAGSYLGTFRTYTHGNIGQLQVLMKNPDHKGPILMMLATLFALAGASGAPGFEETEEIVKLITKQANNGVPWSIKQTLLKNVDPWITTGGLSAFLGYDMSSKYAMQSLVPTWDNLASPLGILYKPLASLWDIGEQAIYSGTVSDNRTKELIKQVIPKSARNAFDNALNISDDGTFEDRFGRNKDYLDAEDMEARKTVGWVPGAPKPLKESLGGKVYQLNKDEVTARQERKQELARRYMELFRTGALTSALRVEITKQYEILGGDISSLERHANEDVINSIARPDQRGRLRGKDTPEDAIEADNPYRRSK